MSWVAVGVTGAGAAKGYMDAKEAKKKDEAHNAYRQALVRNSAWTGMQDPGAGNFGQTDSATGALGGGLQGFAMGSSINGMMGPQQTPIEKPEIMAMNYDPTPNYMQQTSPWPNMQNQPQYQRQGLRGQYTG